MGTDTNTALIRGENRLVSLWCGLGRDGKHPDEDPSSAARIGLPTAKKSPVMVFP
jgi:hypothetical protein